MAPSTAPYLVEMTHRPARLACRRRFSYLALTEVPFEDFPVVRPFMMINFVIIYKLLA